MLIRIQYLLYRLAIRFYYMGIRIASWVLSDKATAWISGREQLKPQLSQFQQEKKHDKSIWVHCASAGEYEQGRTFLEALQQRYSSYNYVLTFFSPSGYQLYRHSDGIDLVCYLPRDCSRETMPFLRAINPAMVFFINNDHWLQLTHQLYKSSIPYYWINSTFTDSWFNRRAMVKSSWARSQAICVQHQASAQFLKSSGVNQVYEVGDTRIDTVLKHKEEEFSDNIIESFIQDERVIIYGSIWPADLPIIKSLLLKHPDWKHILFPHEISDDMISTLEEEFKSTSLYSSTTETSKTDCLIVDTVGILKYAYRYASAAYIGGGFGKGIHNTLEPAAYGIPIVFGPKYKKFQEAIDFITIGAAYSIAMPEEITSIDLDKAGHIRNILHDYFLKHDNSVGKAMEIVEKNTFV